MSKVKGCVFEGDCPRAPIGAVAPAAALADRSRYENDGVFGAGAAAPTWTQLPSGIWVIEFDGGDTILADWVPEITILGRYSVELWAKPDVEDVVNRFLWQNSNGGSDRNSMRIVSGLLSGTTYDGGVFGYGGAVTLNAWVHVVFTNNAKTTALYLNAISYTDAATGFVGATAKQFEIGYTDNGTYGRFSGLMRPPRVYNYALSHDQINAIFADERTLFGV